MAARRQLQMGCGLVFWLVGTALSSVSGQAAADAARPDVKLFLTRDTIFVGELPYLQISLTAPAKQTVSVVKEERLYPRRALYADLLAPDGQRVPGGEPSFIPDKYASDLVSLEAGKSLTYTAEVLHRPFQPGKHTVRVQLTPTADDKFVVKQNLVLTCVEIPEQAIRFRCTVPLPKNPHRNNDTGRLVELLNVQEGKQAELFHCYWGTPGKPQSLRVKRLFPLDPDSRIVAVPKYYDRKEYVQQLWISYNQGGELHFARLADLTGKVLEQLPMSRVFQLAPPKE
ncbi:MAG: hypothetical protein JNM56_09995 [Planctomycetia bacterium]|nr:hypothetical protein [Planctomycetia bacterium]